MTISDAVKSALAGAVPGHAALHTVMSPLFTPRWLDLSVEKLTARAGVRRPRPGVFPAGTGQVRLGSVTAAQPDGVTCAATGLLLLNAAYDQRLATWLTAGDVPLTSPPEIAGVSPEALASPDPRARLAAAAAAVHRRVTRRTLGPFDWPRAYGTPPWGIAREARVPDVRYRHRPVDDRDGPLMDQVIAMLVAATTAGVPVPVYTGGHWARGWMSAAPRHLVLVLPTDDPERLRIYEPGRGKVIAIAPDELRARTTPHAAFGGWTNLAWVLIPVVR